VISDAVPAVAGVRELESSAETRSPRQLSGRVLTDGKQFAVGGERFRFHGVTYGTFKPRHEDGCRFPTCAQIEADFRAMQEVGFTVVRTYTSPPDEMLQLARESGLRLLSDVFYPDWRYLLGASGREQREIGRKARAVVRAEARRLAGEESVLALSLGTEIPADVIRWVGTRRVAGMIRNLAEAVWEEDPERLVTYANYPTAEYLPLEFLDFLTFNVFLERQDDFRRYLTRLHHLAGDRPVVLGEIGLDAGTTPDGELRQARSLNWQLGTALERGIAGTCIFAWTDEWWVGDSPVKGWHFGLTQADRSPRAALPMAQRWNGATVAELNPHWPALSVVICAYNAADTLDECLDHVEALDYPDLEIIVVDDGSTDDTAAIGRRHNRVRLVEIEHAGLSVARNEGFRVAREGLIAYLDSDAYPSPEWPYYLVLGMDGSMVGGVGGPNVPPQDDPTGAQRVARAPGGPVHVLVADDRAEHVPGCNMAFWKLVLDEVGGFDPIYTAAGDDVDLCWRITDRGWELGFHPAALVWHHSRSGTRTYLRQQRGYGRAEALVEARHPHRFTAAGTARWRGRIYNSFAPSLSRERVYRGLYGAASYQSVYQGRGDGMALLRQVGVPLAALLLPTGLLGLASPLLAVPALLAFAFLFALFLAEVLRVQPPRHAESVLTFRCGGALLSVLQPLARTWGRMRNRNVARRSRLGITPLPGPLTRVGRGVVLLPEDRPRQELAAILVDVLRDTGLRVILPSGWEDHDAGLVGSALVRAELVTSSHPPGCVQIRVRRRLRTVRAAIHSALTAAALTRPALAGLLLLVGAIDVGRGVWRTGPVVRQAIGRAAA
jgi:glycosyltransferase involved in cell wall biosynthesis/PAS domain-containing protein